MRIVSAGQSCNAFHIVMFNFIYFLNVCCELHLSTISNYSFPFLGLLCILPLDEANASGAKLPSFPGRTGRCVDEYKNKLTK